jgi:hypothetical protein
MRPVLQVNGLYETKYQMFVLGGFFSNDARKRAQHLLADGRYLQLDANLRYFYDRYAKILAERDEGGSWTDRLRGEGYRKDREIYYAYIERQRLAVIAALERLAELDGVRQELADEAQEKWNALFPPVPYEP